MTIPPLARIPHPYTSINYGQSLYGVDYVDLLIGPEIPTDDVSCPVVGLTPADDVNCVGVGSTPADDVTCNQIAGPIFDEGFCQ